jgi:methyltransferase (TIGR00027 family)
MIPDAPSRTAEFMALFRALETVRRPAADRLFADPFAATFLPPALHAVARLSRLPLAGPAIRAFIDRRWPGARTSAVARTRLIDDAVTAALRDGVTQLVILGAGFDARAYRLPGIDRARVFEVDHPATQAAKRARLNELPAHVTFVGVDFDRDDLSTALARAGFDPAARTFFTWEGVTNYLTATAVDATLRWVAHAAAPESRILFTYVHRGVIDGSGNFAGTAALANTLKSSGEPWTFGLDPAEVPDYLAERGLALIEDVGAAEYRARYMGRAGTGYEFYRAVLAEIRAG